MKYIYVHLPQDEDIGFEERAYRITEGLLEHQNRKVLYLHVEASEVTFCDGRYASYLDSFNIKGYVVRWKYTANESSEAVSEIDSIEDEEEKQAIGKLLRTKHNISAVNFD